MTEYKKGSLWLNFVLESMNYCVLSDYIESIAIPGKIDPIPDSPITVAGVTSYGKNMIRVMEMREIFGKMNLKKCVQEFSIMKDMHVSWVEDLKRYVTEGGEFTKAVDPHKCKFGLWYDNFYTDNVRLRRLLTRISEPHERIHLCGAEIKELKSQEGDHQAHIIELMEQAESICYDDIVPLLNRLIDVYSSANRGVLLVVGDGTTHAGLLVDEVKSLIPCDKAQQKELVSFIEHSDCLGDIVVADKTIMLEVDIKQILKMV